MMYTERQKAIIRAARDGYLSGEDEEAVSSRFVGLTLVNGWSYEEVMEALLMVPVDQNNEPIFDGID